MPYTTIEASIEIKILSMAPGLRISDIPKFCGDNEVSFSSFRSNVTGNSFASEILGDSTASFNMLKDLLKEKFAESSVL